MTKVFQSPAKYIQGPGEMDRLGEYAEGLGKKAFCLITAGGMKRQGDQIVKSFEGRGAEVRFEIFNGECSWNEIERLLKLVQEGAGDLAAAEDYSYPQTYFLEHYYIRPDRQQIQFLCELEVTGRPQNAIKERDYSPANWEGLVPGSVEDEIYRATVDYLKKSKKYGMTRHGKNITVRDALEEYFRISL